MQKLYVADHADFDVFIHGDDPRLLITSGIHGDEYESIHLLTDTLTRYHKLLPSFLYIPQVSPSAVGNKTRTNVRGLDLNRNFFSWSDEPEVKRMREILNGKKFDLHVSFHEDLDPAVNSYYIYDVGTHDKESEAIKSFNSLVNRVYYPTLNGFDDPSDPALGYEFINGYCKYTPTPHPVETGSFEDYIMCNHGAHTVWVPEIPGLATQERKQLIIEKFVLDLLTAPHTTNQ